MNGQRHGDQGLTFIKNRCNKYRVAKDTLVFLDFSDLDHADIVDFFKPSRDRLTDKEIADQLKSGLEDALKNDETLKEEEQRRRQRLVKDKTDDKVQDILKSVLERNPSLKIYLAKGDKTRVPDQGEDEESEFNPRSSLHDSISLRSTIGVNHRKFGKVMGGLRNGCPSTGIAG